MKWHLANFVRDFIIAGLVILATFAFVYYLAYQMHIVAIKSFVESPLLTPLITLFVGYIVFIIYKKTKDDIKKDAANIVLLEVQNAERLLKQIMLSVNKDIPEIPQNIFLMQTESWSKYRYLFVRDFDWNEWDEITDFYNKCQLYDQSVTYNNSFFQKNEEQIRVNLQRVLADYAKDYSDKICSTQDEKRKEKLQKEYLDKREQYINKYMDKNTMYLYSPAKPVSDVKLIISSMNSNISLGTIGIKLKEIADKKN